jgi:serine O-acetyltransferase
MEKQISIGELHAYVSRQLSNLFGYSKEIEKEYLKTTLDRSMNCFEVTNNRYYHKNGNVFFSPYHTGQYAIFLYYLGNTLFRENGDQELANFTYVLNKAMHAVDWYYQVELPEYWGVEHPLSSVLGRAEYSDGFFFYQGCTVGGNKGKYPVLGKNVILYSNATVLGDTLIGDNVLISSGVTVIDEKIPSNSLVFGKTPDLIIKSESEEYMMKHMEGFWRK